MTKVCKICKQPLPFTERNGLKTYKHKSNIGIDCGCFSSDHPEAKKAFQKFVDQNKIKFRKEVKKKDKEQKDTVNSKGLMKLADTYFSRYVRLYFSSNGLCTCYTCGTIKPIKEVDNGHYMKREHKATRYLLNNCRPQCKTCNGDTKHNGKQIEFRENLVNEIGENEVIEIERLSKTDIKANYVFYRETSDFFRKALNDLQKELKVKYW